MIEPDEAHGFANIRLEYGDSSVFNFNLNFRVRQNEFSLKAYSVKNTLSGNLLTGSLEFDNRHVQPQKRGNKSEMADFFNSISGAAPVKTGISEYASILKIFREINRKNNWTEY